MNHITLIERGKQPSHLETEKAFDKVQYPDKNLRKLERRKFQQYDIEHL